MIGRGLRKQNISEESLKVGFYTQCYLLSPVSAAYWATTYANEYVTPDIFFFSRTNLYQYQDYVTWFPFALILLWFFFVEIGMIARERGIGKFRAFLVLLRYVFTLFALLVFVTNTWFFRKATIFGYVLLVLLLILIGAIKDLQKARKDAKPKENR